MLLPDVHTLVYAHRGEAKDHPRYKRWLEELIGSGSPYGMSPLVLSGFVRVVTNPKVFIKPSTLDQALTFVDSVSKAGNCVIINPGAAHLDIFIDLCRKSNAKGNLVADAYLAAISIESNSEWVTADRDFTRFNGLKWRHPLS